MELKRLIVGTAGHVDHGKSTLVKALTGIDPDRLEEEKKRGITIDLGFAHLDIDGYSFSFVDVPGHENYLKNMAAGAIGFDACLLVVDINEGIKAQTREHADIIDFFGVKNVIVVFSKIDRWIGDLEKRKGELKSFFYKYSFSSLRFCDFSVYVDSTRDEIISALKNIADGYRRAPLYDFFLLNIDRSFTLKGFGTVVTGTVISGEVTAGDTLMLMPSVRNLKVKGLSVHGRKVDRISSGSRAAINLADIDSKEIIRGDILITPAALDNYTTGYAVLKLFDIDYDFDIKSSGIYNILLGTSAMNARINKIDRIDDRWLVKFTLLDKYYPLTSRMKFLIRLPSPKITVAGGDIVFVGELKGRKPDIVQIMGYLVEGDVRSAIKKYLECFYYIEKENLYQKVLLKEGDLKKYGFVFEYGNYFFYKPLIEGETERLALEMEKKKFVDLRGVLAEIDPITRKAILENFIIYARSRGYDVSGNVISLSDSSFNTLLNEVLDAMIKDIALTNGKLIAERISRDEIQVNKALIMLGNRDQIKKLDKNGNYIATVVFKKFVTDAVLLAKNDRYVDIGNIRKIIDAPRKILIPLLESLDKTNLFKNIDNKRYLK